jgi:chromosome segregation ATPase
MGKGSGKGGAGALISISYNYDALEEFVKSVKSRFTEHEHRIVELEKKQTALAGKNAVLEHTLQQREEEIRVLRGECKQLAQQAVEVEEQNQALREENALAFTKIYKKLESSATSEGLQKEMMSLKEGTDNRMLVLENLMREIGGDKMKNLIGDVSQVCLCLLLCLLLCHQLRATGHVSMLAFPSPAIGHRSRVTSYPCGVKTHA